MIRNLLCFRVLHILWILALAICSTNIHAEVREVTIMLDSGDNLPACLFRPDNPSTGPIPAVVVAAGAGGAKLIQYRSHCQRLANKNFAVLLIDGSNFPPALTPGADTWRKMPYHLWSWLNHVMVAARLAFSDQWYVKNIRAAVDYVASSPGVMDGRVAVSGFSQSANAALAEASRDPRVKCVVWNNGGWPWIMPYDTEHLPPVLIFHGEDDGVYNVKYARQLESQLKKAGTQCECHIYPKQRHMFTVYYDLDKPPGSRNPALRSSFERLVAFLDRTLRKDGLAANSREGRAHGRRTEYRVSEAWAAE